MPAKFRLSRTDFTRMRGFKRVHGTLFSLSFGILPERKAPGFACVVSAKIAPRATVRNLIKRRVRAVAYGLMKETRPSSVMVLYAKKPAAHADMAAIRTEVISLVQKSGYIG